MDVKYPPLLSVIIPIYNSSQTIKKCVESIINGLDSENRDFVEILMVDDGSKDNTREICENLVNEYFQVKYIYKDNGGVSSARNVGIDNSSGIYIGFIDSDDEWDSKWGNSIINKIKEKKSELYIFSFTFYFGESNYRSVNISEFKGDVKDFLTIIPHLNGDGIFYASVCNKIYESRKIKTLNLRFDEILTFGEDYSFNMEYLRHIRQVETINMPLYRYNCTTPESGVKRFRENFSDMLCRMYEKLSNLLSEYEIYDLGVRNYYSNFISDAWLYITEVAVKSHRSIKSINTVLVEWYVKAPQEILNLAAGKKSNIYSNLIQGFLNNRGMGWIILKIRYLNYLKNIKLRLYSMIFH